MNPTRPPVKIGDFQRPEQILDLIENEHIRDLVALIGMNHGVIAPDGRPEWVVRAAGEFWRCCFGFSNSTRVQSEFYRVGHIWGFWKQMAPQLQGIEQGIIALLTSGQFAQLLHSVMESAPASEAAEFYAGLSEALKKPVDFAPSSPFSVYLVFAIKWREASTLKNTTQIHAWLESILGPNLTGQRDRIAKLCQKIRFPLTDKGGRPRGKPRKGPPS